MANGRTHTQRRPDVTLSTREYRGSLDGVYEHVKIALANLGEANELRDELSLIGPLPVYVLDAHQVVRNKFVVNRSRPDSWRALVLSGKEPVACVDLPPGNSSRTPAVRGSEAANALLKALKLAEYGEGSPNHYDVRIVQLPRLFVTALWLESQVSAFIPTRAGERERPPILALQRLDFVALVRNCLNTNSHAGGPVPRLPGDANDLTRR